MTEMPTLAPARRRASSHAERGCTFCRIAAGELPARVVFEREDVLALHDISPQAPVHVLVIPKRHVASLSAVSTADLQLLGSLLLAAAEAARRCGVADAFRLVVNTGADAGQSVFHLHLHVLGGRPFRWPPG